MGKRGNAKTDLKTQASEAKRLAALQALDVLDSAREAEFDAITALAARLFDMPVALVSLIDADRQWFKSTHGTNAVETPRDVAFCKYTIGGDAILEVTDPRADPRFRDNPGVTGPPGIRYYVGAPLKLASGYRVGTLCMIDFVQRPPLCSDQLHLLEELARLVVVQLESRRLRMLEKRAGVLSAATPDAIVCAGLDGRITHWNPAAERLFGYPASEAIGTPLDIIVPHHHRGLYEEGIAHFAATGESRLLGRTFDFEARRRDGICFPTEMSLAAWTDDGGRAIGLAAIVRDISARRTLEAEKEQTQRFLDTVIDNLPAMLFVKDARTRQYLLWNAFAEEATGLSRDAVVGRTDGELFGEVGEAYMERDTNILRSGVPGAHESRFSRGDGEERIFRTHRVVLPDDDASPLYLLGISEDVTEWRSAQEKAAFLAGNDPLTHLANRAAFLERLESAIAGGRPAALLAIDLDRFKAVNDSHGPEAGDRVLIAAARRIRMAVKKSDLVARIAADEFALLIEGGDVEVRAGRIAERLAARFADPIEFGGLRIAAGVRIGIAVAPEHGKNVDALLRSADTALCRAKQEGPGRFHFFDASMDEAARKRQRIEARLTEAVARDEIGVHYQPIACVTTGRMVGFEALARWTDEELGKIGPDLFIPIAEESGLIVPLGENLLRRAAREAAGWDPSFRLAVNLSPRQMEVPDIAERLLAIVAETGLSPERLEFEVTEGMLIRDPAAALETLNRLKAGGIAITMDDFGTGYSSLSYFRSFPFDKVKIDQSFVKAMGSSGQALAIVQAVIGLARGFGMQVVAEGVESQAQMDALRAEGCTLMQGYLIGRPAPIAAFERAVGLRARPADRGGGRRAA